MSPEIGQRSDFGTPRMMNEITTAMLDRGAEAPDLVPDVRSEAHIGLDAEAKGRMILIGVPRHH